MSWVSVGQREVQMYGDKLLADTHVYIQIVCTNYRNLIALKYIHVS